MLVDGGLFGPLASIAERALRIAAEICIYTNDQVTRVELP